jgi:formate hydrogenlyase subunit 3/multisubunit Na+/H+ antiporter MnhD subunit
LSAPILWILLPLVVSIALIGLRNHRRIAYFGSIILCLVMVLLAVTLPVDTVIQSGRASYKISSTLGVLGREMVIQSQDLVIVALVYAVAAFWMIGAYTTSRSSLFPAFGPAIGALIVASIAVQPFLYAAVLLELIAIIALALFFELPGISNTGVLRFITFQTLGMIFLLFCGWLLSGIDTAPSDLAAMSRILLILGLGFGFLLALFPFYAWVPMMAEQEDTFLFGYVVLMMQTGILFLGMHFLENYAWLRNSAELQQGLLISGSVMVATGGIWSAFQKDLGRIYGYALIMENGFSIIAMGLVSTGGSLLLTGMLLPRILAFGIWGLSLLNYQGRHNSLKVDALQGAGKSSVVFLLGLLIAQFSVGGLPLLAGFPQRLALLQAVTVSAPLAGWAILIGSGGFWIAAWMSLTTLVRSEDKWGKFMAANLRASLLVLVGVVFVLILGLFPAFYSNLARNLLLPFIHLQ